ncbi:SusC/RagA family TonB-linked outer membrane protein [Maribellus sp. YY47]|uniref:SusC/RagA family TonB-linked outer membrane protein n=1 Tax=Maribellus sp. YY47 TaxID=2929486 RepID=UPI0020017E7C|nr:SusC/RagA family TonB-linked outer membrane protein [Maribellus sp. YY47]MCK3684073.1 SusC/RagA family TonB-linked outer membrane protein [Maribellus sp. YY47]
MKKFRLEFSHDHLKWLTIKKSVVIFVLNALLMTCFASALSAQGVLKGKVTDDSNLPLPGVSVVVQNTSNGTITDMDGNYVLNNVKRGDVVVFSFIGMISQEITYSGQAEENIQMLVDTKSLEEVVVTALGIRRDKKTLTYASQEVSGEELMKAKSINFMDALNGKAAGLEIEKSSSGAGGSTRVVLRGFKSLGGTSEPLYVIDGVPIMNIKRGQPGMWGGADQGDGLSQLNPDDIESINVLKGLNASILYGSQGANGVVLITTKKGREGKTNVTLSSTTTFESVLLYPELQFDYGALNGAKESWSSTKGGTNYSEDQMKDFFQVGNNLVNSVTVSGGNKVTTAYFSYSNTSAEGIIPNNEYNKNNLSLKQSTKLLDDKLTLSSNVMLATENVKNRNVAGYYLNPLTGLYNFPRERNWEDYKTNYKYFDEKRNMYLQNVYVVDHHISNPYWIINMEPEEEQTKRIIAMVSGNYSMTDHLTLAARGTYEYVDRKMTQKDYAGSNVTNVSANGRYVFANSTDTKLYSDALLKYDNKFGKLEASGFIGASYSKHSWLGMSADNGTNSLLYPNVFSTQNYPTNTVITESGGETILQSVYGSINLGYNDMLYLDVSARNDWSSTLVGTTDGPSYFYPSVGLVALLSNVFELPEFISFLKVRGSSAQAAKEVPWNAIRSDHTISGSLGGINRNTRQPWTDLKPEKITSNELGFEFKLFEGRVGADFTYYYNKSTNQFLNISLPPEERGLYTTKNINVGEIVNKGVELTVDFIPVQTSAVEWSTAFNFFTNNNEIVELDPDDPTRIIGMGSSEGYETFLRAGGSFGDLYGFMFRRDDQGRIMLDPKNGNPLKTAAKHDVNDWTVGYLGNLLPDFTLSWNNNIQWNRVTIGALISGKFGGKSVSQTESMLDGWGVSKRTGDARDLGYVEINGIQGTTPVTQIDPYLYYSEGKGTGGRNGILEPYVYDRTSIRLSQLSIAYDLDVKKLNLPLAGVNLSLVGQNLFIFYKKAPFDPELAMSTNNSSQSLDNFNVPATRTYGFNIKVTF